MVVPLKSVTIQPRELQLGRGETIQVSVTRNPSNATSVPLVWSSSDPTIFTVDAKHGIVKASETLQKNGSAYLQVQTLGDNSVKDKILVDVLPMRKFHRAASMTVPYSLSNGAVAGICLGVCLGVVLIGWLYVWFFLDPRKIKFT